MATMMSDVDAHTIEGYLEANSKSVPMRELANNVIKARMQNLLRQTATKPADQMLPLNPTNRQHQLFHKLAVEEKALPKILRASSNTQSKRNQPTSFKAKKQFKTQFKRQNQKPNFAGIQRQQTQPQKKQFAGASRPRVKNQNQTSRGNQGQQQQQNGSSKLKPKKAETPQAAVAQLRNAYDITKISDQLEHFGNTTPDVQLMLQHQLIQRSLDIAPNPKKPSKTPNLAN